MKDQTIISRTLKKIALDMKRKGAKASCCQGIILSFAFIRWNKFMVNSIRVFLLRVSGSIFGNITLFLTQNIINTGISVRQCGRVIMI